MLFSVGMASQSFTYNDFGELILIPDITLEGLTEETLEEYSKNFTFSGTCYKGLYQMSSPDSQSSKYRSNGYIFAVSLHKSFFLTKTNFRWTTEFIVFIDELMRIL